ncbi:uncharacterized protein TNCV_4936311 [Trichonephila clavipes]|nr:uncharacterized protein TNCV_4936311 [Trichonephila clavipes]
MLCSNSLTGSGILLKHSPLDAVHEWQYCRLNYQAEVQICSQWVWDNHESAPAVTMIIWPPYDKDTTITGAKAETAFIRKHSRSPLHPSMSSGVTSLAS